VPKEYSRARSYAIFKQPQITSGKPAAVERTLETADGSHRLRRIILGVIRDRVADSVFGSRSFLFVYGLEAKVSID
jgi:hypothetical protein